MNTAAGKLTKIFKSVTFAAALVLPFASFNSLHAAEEKTPVIMEKAGEIDLSVLIQQWASEMDDVYAETHIEPKDTSKKIFDRLGIQDKAFTRYVTTIQRKRKSVCASLPRTSYPGSSDDRRRSDFSESVPSD